MNQQFRVISTITASILIATVVFLGEYYPNRVGDWLGVVMRDYWQHNADTQWAREHPGETNPLIKAHSSTLRESITHAFFNECSHATA